MERYITNDSMQPASFTEIFDCNKMKNLINGNSKMSFSERFSKWLNEHSKEASKKVWTDVEYHKSI